MIAQKPPSRRRRSSILSLLSIANDSATTTRGHERHSQVTEQWCNLKIGTELRALRRNTFSSGIHFLARPAHDSHGARRLRYNAG
jgi:hypothetical protein